MYSIILVEDDNIEINKTKVKDIPTDYNKKISLKIYKRIYDILRNYD